VGRFVTGIPELGFPLSSFFLSGRLSGRSPAVRERARSNADLRSGTGTHPRE